MSNYKSIVGSIFLFVLIYLPCTAQTVTTADNSRVDFLSPQAANFVKYGNLAPSLYTGQLGLNIPLIEAKDNNFNISVGLNNNSGGFMPGQATGPLGMSWYLSAGGAITRKINGYPDDYREYVTGINYPQYLGRGYFQVTKSFNPNKNDVFNFNVGATESVSVWNVGYAIEHPYNTGVIYDYAENDYLNKIIDCNFTSN